MILQSLINQEVIKIKYNLTVPSEVHVDFARNNNFHSHFNNTLTCNHLRRQGLSRGVPGFTNSTPDKCSRKVRNGSWKGTRGLLPGK